MSGIDTAAVRNGWQGDVETVDALCDEVDRLRAENERQAQYVDHADEQYRAISARMDAANAEKRAALAERDETARQFAELMVQAADYREERDAVLARVAELEAENERLRRTRVVHQMPSVRACNIHAGSFATVKAERDALRAAVDRVRALCDEWRRSDRRAFADAFGDELHDALTNESARLAALDGTPGQANDTTERCGSARRVYLTGERVVCDRKGDHDQHSATDSEGITVRWADTTEGER